jgi:hypothetical protein
VVVEIEYWSRSSAVLSNRPFPFFNNVPKPRQLPPRVLSVKPTLEGPQKRAVGADYAIQHRHPTLYPIRVERSYINRCVLLFIRRRHRSGHIYRR